MNIVNITVQDEIEALVIKAKKGDSSAANSIYKSFDKFIYKSAMSDCFKSYDQDTLMQTGNESVVTALKLYKLGDSVPFIPYAMIAIAKGFRNLPPGKMLLSTNL